ncbi:dihydroxyacetone kinase DhaL subunit [Geodermatophilus amargosae]|uniref:Dihydroxyacetone kinase DhaL subunit n=1 Tax=Geodermatophilus amargosae TaxID=1296565 RepID=A0A1I7CKI6_9ACTN|nr:dihydroxyacetone kinase subunit DhaL [Geodermatophilus amargosae]SFT99951.1 dihydroxyacetone kinase DhaL subunit [Geodermatophilus amargosae]
MSVAVGVDDLTAWLRRFAEVVHERRDELTALDAAIGDADHGSNMDRGMAAVVAVLDDAPPTDAAGLLKKTGATLVSKVGGASGPLYGTLFLRMAGAAGDGDLDDAAVARALRAGLEGVLARGKAEAGDKTMVDALGPACDALDAGVGAGKPLADALAAAAEAAAQGRDATVPLVARKGRASYLGERSAGHMDPGATSVTMLVEAAAATMGRS